MRKQPAQGLLIRDATIEVLELVRSKKNYLVSGYGWARLPEGVVKGGKVMNVKVLGGEIKKLMVASRSKRTRGPMVLGMPQSQVFLKAFTIPKFEEKELKEAITWHVGSLAPVLPRDAYNSYEVIGKGKNNELKILLASAPQMVVDKYLEACELAGVEVESIEPLAVARTRLIDPKMLLNKSAASVHLYNGRLAVGILVNGKLWFSKESVVIQGREQMIGATVNELIKFFTEKKDKDVVGVSGIIYSGDKAGIEVLEANLKGFRLKLIKAESGIVLERSKIVSEVEAVKFAPVLGLAMRSGLHKEGLINLLPTWPKQKAELGRLTKVLSRAVVMLGMVVWLVVIGLGSGWWWLEQEEERLKGEVERLKGGLMERQETEYLSWGERFNQTVEVAELIEESRVSFAEVLNRLGEIMPRGIKLTAFSYQALSDRWSMAGIADGREEVLGFDKALKESDFFAKARLYFSSLETNEGVVFRFSGGGDEG